MNLSETYQLVYTGLDQPQHLLQSAKSGVLASALSRTDNARLAEWMLERMDFDKQTQAKAKAFGIQNHDVSSVRLADYVTHIHRAKSEEIRSRFAQPPITDDEAAKLLFEEKLAKELQELSKPVVAELKI